MQSIYIYTHIYTIYVYISLNTSYWISGEPVLLSLSLEYPIFCSNLESQYDRRSHLSVWGESPLWVACLWWGGKWGEFLSSLFLGNFLCPLAGYCNWSPMVSVWGVTREQSIKSPDGNCTLVSQLQDLWIQLMFQLILSLVYTFMGPPEAADPVASMAPDMVIPFSSNCSPLVPYSPGIQSTQDPSPLEQDLKWL